MHLRFWLGHPPNFRNPKGLWQSTIGRWTSNSYSTAARGSLLSELACQQHVRTARMALLVQKLSKNLNQNLGRHLPARSLEHSGEVTSRLLGKTHERE